MLSNVYHVVLQDQRHQGVSVVVLMQDHSKLLVLLIHLQLVDGPSKVVLLGVVCLDLQEGLAGGLDLVGGEYVDTAVVEDDVGVPVLLIVGVAVHDLEEVVHLVHELEVLHPGVLDDVIHGQEVLVGDYDIGVLSGYYLQVFIKVHHLLCVLIQDLVVLECLLGNNLSHFPVENPGSVVINLVDNWVAVLVNLDIQGCVIDINIEGD